jgi:hypothetical protein
MMTTTTTTTLTLLTTFLVLLNVNLIECMELRSVTWVPVASSEGAKARSFHVGAIVEANLTQYAWYLGGLTDAKHELCDVDMLNLSENRQTVNVGSLVEEVDSLTLHFFFVACQII